MPRTQARTLPRRPSPTYAGWVPTIAGQLSFSLIGMNGTAPTAVSANIEYTCPRAGHPRRHVAVIQKRVTKDWPFTFWPIPYFWPAIAAHFLMVGETAPAARPELVGTRIGSRRDEIGVLHGTIYIMAHHERLSKAKDKCVADIRQLIARAGDAAPRAVIAGHSSLLSDIELAIQDGRDEGLTILEGEFELFRTGEFRLHIQPPPAAAVLGNLDTFCDLLARNVYYFTKDVSHRHYHHRARGDNMLPLVRTTPEDDEHWRRETLWSLMRAVLEMRRRNRLPGHQSAMGVLAYAEAFQGLLARVKRARNGSRHIPTTNTAFYDFGHTRMSLTATIEQHTFFASQWMHVQAVVIAVALAVPALWAALLQVSSEVGDPAPPIWAAAIVVWCIEKPHLLFGLVFAAGTAYAEFSRQSLMIIPPLAAYQHFLGGWIDAVGVSFSKITRACFPAAGDVLGARISAFLGLVLIAGLITAIGVVTHLWDWPDAPYRRAWLITTFGLPATGALIRLAMHVGRIRPAAERAH